MAALTTRMTLVPAKPLQMGARDTMHVYYCFTRGALHAEAIRLKHSSCCARGPGRSRQQLPQQKRLPTPLWLEWCGETRSTSTPVTPLCTTRRPISRKRDRCVEAAVLLPHTTQHLSTSWPCSSCPHASHARHGGHAQLEAHPAVPARRPGGPCMWRSACVVLVSL